MLKRVCDRCGKEIVDDENWFQIKIDKCNESCVYCSAGRAEFCEKCFNEFKEQLANKT